MPTNNRKKHTTNHTKKDKGNWRYSNFQKIQKFDMEEIKIKNVAIGKSGFAIAISENIKNVEDVDSHSNI